MLNLLFFKCASNLQAHLVCQEFFIHVKQPAFQLVYPLTDNEALTLLKKNIFHWDLVPCIAFLIQHIYLIWSGKEQSGDARETDSDASELEDDVMGLENTAFTHSGQLANIDL